MSSKMLWLRDGAFQKAVFIQGLVVLLLVLCTGGQHSGTTLPVVALVGEDVLLPCRLDSASDPVSMVVEWGRPDLKPRFVHVWHEGKNLLTNQNPSYKSRTLLSVDKLKLGDLSLTLLKVKLSDSGTYRCFTPELNRESTVKLTVGAVSLPFISEFSINNNIGVLQCESKGWFPEPEVLWLDGAGNPLSARPAETLRSPDGLFTVSSKVTVEKKDRDSFTCRVQQENINQTRETHIQITGFMDSDEVPPSSAARITVTLVVLFSCALAVFLMVWNSKRSKRETRMKLQRKQEELEQKEQLIETKERNEEELKELKELLQREEQRKKDFEKVVQTLRTQTQGLEEVAKGLRKHAKEMEDRKAETEKQVESVKRETSHKSKGFSELEGIIFRHVADKTKMNLEKLSLDTERLQVRAKTVLEEMKLLNNQENQSEPTEDKKH